MVFAVRSDLEHRTLSGTIAHEATHILIRRKYGLLKSLLFPRWKTEGYCEYVGGGSNLSHEVGMKRWRENPNDDSTYDYFKYYMMVSYLLDVEKVSVGDLFDGSYDTRDLESKVLR
jgi:hypothetical protein